VYVQSSLFQPINKLCACVCKSWRQDLVAESWHMRDQRLLSYLRVTMTSSINNSSYHLWVSKVFFAVFCSTCLFLTAAKDWGESSEYLL